MRPYDDDELKIIMCYIEANGGLFTGKHAAHPRPGEDQKPVRQTRAEFASLSVNQWSTGRSPSCKLFRVAPQYGRDSPPHPVLAYRPKLHQYQGHQLVV